MSDTKSDQGQAASIFANTYRSFRDGLSTDEKQLFAEFPNSKEMIASVQKQCDQDQIHQSRLTMCIACVESFGKRMEPFFDVVGVFVSSHPEYAAILWGSVRLMFQLGINYIAFLEKLCSMLNQMAAMLPAYEDVFEALMSLNHRCARQFNPRFSTALAYIYQDVLSFCRESSMILLGKRGMRAKMRAIWDISWRPFDIRFAGILDRFRQHESLINSEVRSVSTTIIAEHYRRFDEELAAAERRREQGDAANKVEEQAVLDSRIKEIHKWIQAPDWEDPYRSACKRQFKGTGEWLFSQTAYKQWVDDSHTRWSSQTQGRQIFLVEGKPGYGKTTLCSMLIQKLQKDENLFPAFSNRNSFKNPGIVFYFFDKRQTTDGRGNTRDAYRALLAQLFHIHKDDRGAIDTVSLLMHGRCQPAATIEEILILLDWYFEQYPKIVLVLDGVDESDDPTEFLGHIPCLKGETSAPDNRKQPDAFVTAIAIFTRPDLTLPRPTLHRLASASHRLRLTGSLNFEDIEAFLRPRITNLVLFGVVGDDFNMRVAITNATKHANGMFLWARLLVEYLESDAISEQDIIEALDNLVHLEGLDALYSAILDNLYRKNPEKARRNIKRMFEWMSLCRRPLHVKELETAVSISGGDIPTRKTVIKNFEKSLDRISGALIEVAKDRTVRFIHASVKEYLLSREPMDETCKNFKVEVGRCNLGLARSCLFYLSRCVPPVPLSGNSQTTPDKSLIHTKFPFLKYAVESWTQHASDGMRLFTDDIGGTIDSTGSHQLQGFFHDLRELMVSREKVTTWIEASWVFSVIPDVTELVSCSTCPHRPRMHGQGGRIEIRKICTDDFLGDLMTLSTDLQDLSKNWSSVLRANPNEIWEPSIAAFQNSRFFVSTEAARTTCLRKAPCKTGQVMLSLRSQVSTDAQEVGLLKISIPRELFEDLHNLKRNKTTIKAWLQRFSKGWNVLYEVWSLERMAVKFQLSLKLPNEDVGPWLADWVAPIAFAWSGENEELFTTSLLKTPYTISEDLRKFFIMGCLVWILDDAPHLLSEHGYGTAKGCIFERKYIRPWSGKAVPRQGCSQFGVYDFAGLFSPLEDSFLLIRPAPEPTVGKDFRNLLNQRIRTWELVVFSGFSTPKGSPARYTTTEEHIACPGSLHDVEEFFTFHPNLPVLASSVPSDISSTRIGYLWLWCFEGSGPSQRVCLDQNCLSNLSFSSCGNFLHGVTESNELVVLNITSELQHVLSSRVEIHETPRKADDSVWKQKAPDGKILLSEIGSAGLPSVQKPNTVVFGRSNSGAAAMSFLRQLKEQSAVVLQTLTQDGKMHSETLTRVPESLVLSEAVLIRPPNSDPENFLLVFNVPRKDFWAFNELGTVPSMPTILKRAESSVPIFFGCLPMAIEFEEALGIGEEAGKDDSETSDASSS